jgi:hypothetical protein
MNTVLSYRNKSLRISQIMSKYQSFELNLIAIKIHIIFYIWPTGKSRLCIFPHSFFFFSSIARIKQIFNHLTHEKLKKNSRHVLIIYNF